MTDPLRSHLGYELRDEAVRRVDQRYHFTAEFAPSPEAHRQEYADEEHWLLWRDRAIGLLERAAGHLRDDEVDDGDADTSAASLCLRIAVDEADPDDLLPYPFVDEEPEALPCTCRPGLVEGGGWSSTCPEHGYD